MLQCNVLAWNYRGIVNHETQRALIDMVYAQKPNLIFLSETLANPSVINSLQTSLGFDDNLCFPCQEGSQGVALLWKKDLPAHMRSYSANHIDVVIGDVNTDSAWRFTGIYGFASRTQRHKTWQLIQTLAAEDCSLPWLMTGDFNEVMCRADKSGGPLRESAAMAAFHDTMASCGLIDMKFSGSRFTWENKYTKERLNRGFCTMQWRHRFPLSRVLTLHPSESDHCPILVEVKATNRKTRKQKQRFRFEEMWHSHGDCRNIIQDSRAVLPTGTPLAQVAERIKNTGNSLLTWHNEKFSKKRNDMRILQEKMNDIMRQPFSPSQHEELRQLHIQYSTLLTQQETYWKQRSKALWLKEGDRNTALFHQN